jgi:hypothetical protein
MQKLLTLTQIYLKTHSAIPPKPVSKLNQLSMMKIANIQQELTPVERLTAQDLQNVKGGKIYDDKRRMRPGGGTTSSPCKIGG